MVTRAYNPGIAGTDVRHSKYLLTAAEHLVPAFGIPYSMAASEPIRLGENAKVHHVKGDYIASLSPYIDAKHVEMHDKKDGVRSPHSLENFVEPTT
jgi:hypothetical protein